MRDAFGRLIKTDFLGKKIPTKRLKREVLAENIRKGKAAEEMARFDAAIQGIEYERTGRGHDFKAYKRSIITGKREFKGYREIKSSSTAPISKLQQKTKKKTPNYKVIRVKPLIY